MNQTINNGASQGETTLTDANATAPGRLVNTIETEERNPTAGWIDIEKCITFDKNGISGINYDLTARWVLQSNYVIHIIETDNTFIYRDGVYEDFAEVHLKKLLYDSFENVERHTGQSLLKKNDISEVMERVKMWSIEPIGEIKCDRHFFNMANGILDLETFELLPHSPEWILLSKSPVEYNPDSKCPAFLKFRDEALDPKYHDLIEEIMGYVLWNEHNIQKAFMFLGPKRAGKGTLQRVFEQIIGDKDCSHVSLQDLTDNRFMRAQLFGKKLNTSGDLPSNPISDPGIFKNLTGEDKIEAENKFEHPFSFRNIAKLIFSANSLPKTRVPDDAFYNRWIIIPFEKSAFGREDAKLTQKLTTEEELSGLVNLAIVGLQRLRDNGWKFTYEDDAGSIYKRSCEPIIAFLQDRCEVSDEFVSKSVLVQAYNEYAKQNSLPQASSKIAFGKTMMDQTAIPVETTHPGIDGKQVEAWRGIRLKE